MKALPGGRSGGGISALITLTPGRLFLAVAGTVHGAGADSAIVVDGAAGVAVSVAVLVGGVGSATAGVVVSVGGVGSVTVAAAGVDVEGMTVEDEDVVGEGMVVT